MSYSTNSSPYAGQGVVQRAPLVHELPEHIRLALKEWHEQGRLGSFVPGMTGGGMQTDIDPWFDLPQPNTMPNPGGVPTRQPNTMPEPGGVPSGRTNTMPDPGGVPPARQPNTMPDPRGVPWRNFPSVASPGAAAGGFFQRHTMPDPRGVPARPQPNTMPDPRGVPRKRPNQNPKAAAMARYLAENGYLG